jgi:hypothetical protein
MKRFLQQAGLLLLMMLVGTLVDHAVHALRPEWAVPTEYFTNKILFGVVWGLAGYYALRTLLAVTRSRTMALVVPAIIAIALQTRYFYQGRDFWGFVVFFLFAHYLMFLPGAFLAFVGFPSVFPVSVPRAVSGIRRLEISIVLIVGVELLFYLYFKLFSPFY